MATCDWIMDLVLLKIDIQLNAGWVIVQEEEMKALLGKDKTEER